MTMQLPLAYAKAIELAIQCGAPQPLHQLPGCWEHSIQHDGRTWWFAINGHGKPKHFEPPDSMGMDVPPYAVGVMCNGWIAGIIDAGGGALLGASEDDVIAALDSELEPAV